MNKDTENKDIDYAKSLVEEMVDTPMTRGRRTGSMREFDKILPNLSNQQLIDLASFIGHLIEKNKDEDILGVLLDTVLENITGTK